MVYGCRIIDTYDELSLISIRSIIFIKRVNMKKIYVLLIFPFLITSVIDAKKAKKTSRTEMPQGGLNPLPQEFDSINNMRQKSMTTRFETIKVSTDVARDHIKFWSRQLSEHALFLHLGLEEQPFKDQGLELHKKFEQFRDTMSDETLQNILPLAKELRDYKINVLTTLNSGKWLGWIFPQFARHIILELDYLVDKLNAIKYSDKDEVAFWNVINGEHAGFAVHLLDPSERKLFDQGDKLSKKIGKIVKSEKEMLVQISLKAAKELDEYNKAAQAGIKGNKIKSVIHPALIDHVVREGQRSIETLSKLKDNTGAIFPTAIE